MNLKLDKPFIVFDLETTGLGEPVRIVQVAAIKYLPDGTSEERTKLVNPQRPIEPEATAIHGVTDAMVANEKPFASYARGIAEFFVGCDLCGFNVWKYDLKILKEELARARVSIDFTGSRIIDVMAIYHHFFPRDLAAAYQEYCGAQLANGHDAMADARATREILLAQIERHGLPDDLAALGAAVKQMTFSRSGGGGGGGGSQPYGGRLRVESGQTLINFGKHRGQSLEWMAKNERGYLEWIVSSDFTDDIKAEVRKHL